MGIVESMKIGPPMSFDDERLAQLTAIEQAMAEIKTQLHMDRRRLAKLNVGQALKLQIDLTNLETRKQRIVESMKIGPPMSFDDERLAQLTAIEQAMAEIHMGRRRLVKGNVA